VIDKIPTVGLAKKFETIVIKVEENSFQEINLPKDSQGLFLLQNLRDEAHRFANAYRKKLIQKSQLV
jgi:excinuclease ABC subunit C